MWVTVRIYTTIESEFRGSVITLDATCGEDLEARLRFAAILRDKKVVEEVAIAEKIGMGVVKATHSWPS
jgi:hypothetical protein